MRTVPVTRSIIEAAARYGKESGTKLADAIHVATAVAAGCITFASNDIRLKLPPGIRKLDLRDLAPE